MQYAYEKGFDNAILMDPFGFVAEFASSNLFLVYQNEIYTPEANGTFLEGITRRRVLKLCEDLKIKVKEVKVSLDMLENASEIFSSGNYGKIMYLNNFNGKELSPGKYYKMIKKAYWEFSNNFLI